MSKNNQFIKLDTYTHFIKIIYKTIIFEDIMKLFHRKYQIHFAPAKNVTVVN